jgi:hypothetical protein
MNFLFINDRITYHIQGLERNTVTLCISFFGHLRAGLNHKILDVALLRLRFCSIGPAKSERLLVTLISFQALSDWHEAERNGRP